MDYEIELLHSDKDVAASVPELPGFHLQGAEDEADAIAHFQEAIVELFSGAKRFD